MGHLGQCRGYIGGTLDVLVGIGVVCVLSRTRERCLLFESFDVCCFLCSTFDVSGFVRCISISSGLLFQLDRERKKPCSKHSPCGHLVWKHLMTCHVRSQSPNLRECWTTAVTCRQRVLPRCEAHLCERWARNATEHAQCTRSSDLRAGFLQLSRLLAVSRGSFLQISYPMLTASNLES